MATYERKEREKAYRRVNITAAANPKFTDFNEPGELVSYPDAAVVLEVLREDGTTELHYNGAVGTATYKAGGTNQFLMSKSVPITRLWVRKSDGTGIPYKIPAGLPEKDGLMEVLVPCGTLEMEIVGDKYFEMVYDLKRL